MGEFCIRSCINKYRARDRPCIKIAGVQISEIVLGKSDVVSVLLGSYCFIQSITPQGPNLRIIFASEGCNPERKGSVSELYGYRDQSKHSSCFSSTSRKCRSESSSDI